jgi:heme exporter protein B
MTLNMLSKLIKLSAFELKKNLFHSIDWLSNGLFLLVNIVIFPFTVNPSSEILSQLFLSVIMTSMLLGIVLITNHIFDEDASDGSLDQYLIFGIPMHLIYLSKVIAISIEFMLMLTFIFPFTAIFYSIEFYIIIKIWLVMLLSVPLITSISIFGSMLTINLRKNSAISILLIFPLLISSLISLSLAAERILSSGILSASLPYIEMNLGLTIILIPALCWLSKYLQ